MSSNSGTNIVLTGDRPTGPLHLGHFVGSLQKRVAMQGTVPMFVIVADTQVMNNDPAKAKQVRKNTLEVVKDYLAVGLDPTKVTFFLQSQVLELFELTTYLSNFATLAHILRNPTIKAENEAYNQTMSMGFLNYPISQTADIVLFDANLVPVGADQLAILDYANDLLARFNHHTQSDFFRPIKALLSDTNRLVGVDGNAKMSKSLGNAIYLSDDEKTVKAQVHKMYTDNKHLKVSDPGQVEGNVVFMFLDVFHENKQELAELKAHYARGGLGDMVLKRMLTADLEATLGPIRQARNAISDEYALDVLAQGTLAAQQVAKMRMAQIKEALFG